MKLAKFTLILLLGTLLAGGIDQYDYSQVQSSEYTESSGSETLEVPPTQEVRNPPELTVFKNRDGSDGPIDQLLMTENFYPDYLSQRPIDRPIRIPYGIFQPSLIIGNNSFPDMNQTEEDYGDYLCDLPLNPDNLIVEDILDDLDYRNLSTVREVIELARDAFWGSKDIADYEYTNMSLYIDMANSTFRPFIYFIETSRNNSLLAAFKLAQVDSLYNFTDAEARELGQMMLNCTNGGFVKYYDRLGFEILAADWFVFNLNVVAVSCQNVTRIQVLYFSSLVEGRFLRNQFNDSTIVAVERFFDKWLWTQFLDSLSPNNSTNNGSDDIC